MSYLEPVAIGFLDYVEALGRPLLHGERKTHRWILVAFESPSIKRECTAMPKDRLRYYTDLMSAVRAAILPDPAKQVMLGRDHDGATARTSRGLSRKKGEHSLDLAPFEGVHIRRLNAREIVERVEMLARSCAGIAILTNDLGVSKKARRQGKILKRMARQVATLGQALVAECYPQQETRDNREEDPDLEKMAGDLAEMEALKKTKTGGGGVGGCPKTRL